MHINAAVLILALCGPLSALAQAPATPDTAGMIEALRPAASRTSRNLMVRPAASAATATPPAAASSALAAAVPPAASATPPAAVAPTPETAAAATPASPSLSLAIQFELNSARVRPESGAVLGDLVAALLSPELKGSRFAIEGHTDASGTAARNLALSRDRAEEVRLFLVALGVHPARLKAVGKGATEPVNARDPLAAENRRVRVVTLE